MKSIDRKTCALLKAATVEAERHRAPTVIVGFPHHDRREYGQAPVRASQMTPAELDKYLEGKSKEWGQPLKAVEGR